jgi:hypothetical protein
MRLYPINYLIRPDNFSPTSTLQLSVNCLIAVTFSSDLHNFGKDSLAHFEVPSKKYRIYTIYIKQLKIHHILFEKSALGLNLSMPYSKYTYYGNRNQSANQRILEFWRFFLKSRERLFLGLHVFWHGCCRGYGA